MSTTFTQIERMKKYSAASMFSGCGGMDLGFTQQNFNIVWSNDIDKNACETYRKNIGAILECDIREVDITTIPRADVLTAGFPCQPFSNAGLRKGVADKRGDLISFAIKYAEHSKPKVIIFENVRGLLSSKSTTGRPLIEEIEMQLNRIGYVSSYRLLNFSHFGVPQNRLRVILIAVEKGKVDPSLLFPEIEAKKELSIERTLQGLDERISNQTEIMRLNPQALHYGKLIPEGGSWKSIPYEELPLRWKKIRDNMQRYHYPNFFRRYHRSDIMGTITASFKPENAAVWHPIFGRIFSVREIARFQTFPDDFIFYGDNVKSKYQQIGNAVPPLIISKIAQKVKLYLDGNHRALENRLMVESYDLNVNRPLHKQNIQVSELGLVNT